MCACDMGPTKNKKKFKVRMCPLCKNLLFSDYLCNHNINSDGVVQVVEEKGKKEKQANIYIYQEKMALIFNLRIGYRKKN